MVCRIWMQCKRIVAFYDSSLFLCIVGKRFCGYTVHMETKKTTQFKQKGGFLLCIIQQELMKHLQDRNNRRVLTGNQHISLAQD